MADQVNLTGSLASSLPLTLAAAPSRPAPEKQPSAPASDIQPQKTDTPASEGATTPEKAVVQINSHLQQAATDLKIQVDKGTGRTVFKVVDEHTGAVVLQVPSEEVLAMARNLRALDSKMGASGVLVDKQG
ncbi:hypothetical protein GETHLI_16840 [Geothrix limicola]|uniref:Flagellar protein FlaG n=1 Tax=Geothrix limicola TaxID=2927978 RepID=A0ABQ5QEV6_9BACT|nr:flagellar protein FlaG [Geothrix limicola]GLH73182.1 hypothetical protein GETHLI_16840 [Geothrix limicola]